MMLKKLYVPDFSNTHNKNSLKNPWVFLAAWDFPTFQQYIFAPLPASMWFSELAWCWPGLDSILWWITRAVIKTHQENSIESWLVNGYPYSGLLYTIPYIYIHIYIYIYLGSIIPLHNLAKTKVFDHCSPGHRFESLIQITANFWHPFPHRSHHDLWRQSLSHSVELAKRITFICSKTVPSTKVEFCPSTFANDDSLFSPVFLSMHSYGVSSCFWSIRIHQGVQLLPTPGLLGIFTGRTTSVVLSAGCWIGRSCAFIHKIRPNSGVSRFTSPICALCAAILKHNNGFFWSQVQ